MPGPPVAFKSAPDGEVPALPPATILYQPVMSISYPDGCDSTFAYLQLDRMPVMTREPQAIPDIPGGGYSYAKFIEYLAMGVTPGAMGQWSGAGAFTWAILVDGIAIPTVITLRDGTPGPFGIPISAVDVDFTVAHTWQITATYHDRPDYSEFYLDPVGSGVVAFGPSTNPADPNVPYVRDGITFGCPSRSPASFPTVTWGDANYYDPWVIAHHNVSDMNGPTDRWGNYLGLTGPWGSSVPKQFLASVGIFCDGSYQSGDVYGVSLIELVNTATYAEVTHPVASTVQPLPACTPARSNPVFDVTRAHKAFG